MINNITDLNNLRKEVAEKLNAAILGAEIHSTMYGVGTIKQINSINPATKKYDMVFDIDFNGDVKTLYYSYAHAHLMASVITDTIDLVLTQAAEEYDAFFAERARISKIKAEEAAKQREAERIEREAKIAERKRKEMIAKQIKKFKALATEKNIEISNSYFATLGWLAKHVTTITAAMPDYLETYFISKFGDVPHRAVDSTYRTPAGNQSQWAMSFAISIDDIENAPISIKTKFGDKKHISDIHFIYPLVDDFGFKFGKIQDHDEILAHIPNQYKAEFEAGYSA